MEPSANHPSSDQPKGDLEHLFRQKFAEAEVMPRRNLWEQIDHELLVQQNEAYRHRLVQHRWLAAACILLVLAAGAWAIIPSLLNRSTIATIGKPNASEAVREEKLLASSSATATVPAQVPLAANGLGSAELLAAAPSNNPRQPASASGAAMATPSGSLASSYEAESEIVIAAKATVVPTLAFSSEPSPIHLGSMYLGQRVNASSFPAQGTFGRYASSLSATESARQKGFFLSALMKNATDQLMATAKSGAAWMALTDTLRKAALPAGPSMLAAQQEVAPESKPRAEGRRVWKWSATVAAASYNPNVNFSRAAGTALSLNNAGVALDAQNVKYASQAALYEQAATEYRQNLQARPAIRGRLGATRPLGRRWELGTGVEVAQQAAMSQFSATTAAYYPRTADAYTGNSAPYSRMLAANSSNGTSNYTLNSSNSNSTNATRYRYTSVGVPVAMRYGSPKNGWSLYATLGAAVNVLLGSKVEMEGNTEATRNYNLGSSDSPYRKVLASVRGGGGARYRAADGQWSVLVGPEADLGLTTLNADPAQSFFKRSRPYSVGLATSVEFGGAKSLVVNP
ncbi:MAG TPA: hypothetical protein VF598_12200 [Hymenobacter sp.]|jgi:hypothetical protein